MDPSSFGERWEEDRGIVHIGTNWGGVDDIAWVVKTLENTKRLCHGVLKKQKLPPLCTPGSDPRRRVLA